MNHKSYRSFLTSFAFLAIFCIFSLTSCDAIRNSQKPDRDANYEIQDYRDALAPRPIPDKSVAKDDSAPSLRPYITGAAGGDAYKSMPIVSVDVQGQYALRTLFYELAREGKFDLELDPRIVGSIYFSASERPLDEVLRRVADMAGLRYTFKDNILRVEIDTPYNKSYKIDYLNYVRSSQSNINTNISVVSTEGGTDSGSNFSASSESNSDFWAELDEGLQQILNSPSRPALRTGADPMVSSTIDTVKMEPIGGDQAPDVILNVSSLPVSGANDNSNNQINSGGKPVPYSINKQAGLINVYATGKQHEEIAKYLQVLKRSITSQVLIEAKILQVSLTDQYSTGIDWSAVGSSGFLGGIGSFPIAEGLDAINPSFPQQFPVSTPSKNAVFGYLSGDFNMLVQALSVFGTVRGLASPRLSVVNNQPATLSVADNIVYFEIDVENNQGNDNNQASTTVDSTIKTVPEGVLINVLPSIDLDNRTISMSLRPSVTRVRDFKVDPAGLYIASLSSVSDPSLVSSIPEMSVQEIDSVINVRSGQAIVIGGLLQDEVVGVQQGLPGLNEMPLAGALFRENQNYIQKKELVIMIKATILDNPSDSITDTDRDLYKAFARDRRPWEL